MNIVPGNQQVPAHYLNRHFAIDHNLPKLAPLADAANSFPAMASTSATALAAIALARLEAALLGADQASDADVAGSVASWDAEIVAARAEAVDALSAVKASHPRFATAADIDATLTEFAQDKGTANDTYEGPNQIDDDWATANVDPTGSDIPVQQFANNTPISVNFITVAAGADADSDVLRVSEFNGDAVDYSNDNLTQDFFIGTKKFTLTKATGVITSNATAVAQTWTGTFKIADDEGGETDAINWSIENQA